jgi:hypothetical protein
MINSQDAMDMLAHKLGDAITALINQGLARPIYCAVIGSNGAIAGLHYLEQGGDGLACHPVAEYFPNGVMSLPIQVFLTDGEKTGRFIIRESGSDAVPQLLQ